MTMWLIIFTLITILLLAGTLLPLWRNSHWAIRDLDFPRVQFSAVAFIVLAAELLLLDAGQTVSWVLMAATTVCLAFQLWWVIPYTPFWSCEVPAAKVYSPELSVKILTANVLATNRDAPALIALVQKHQPDILVTLESNEWWQEQLDSLEVDMPYTMKCPLENLYGMHVYSRLALHDTCIEYLVEDDVPSMHAQLELRSGDKVRMHLLHPAPPSPTENRLSAERDAELIVVARSVAGSDQPIIVTGDLNDVAWSSSTRLFRKISGLLDPRVGRGMFNTFHADYFFLRWPLDHLFHSHHFSLRSIERLPTFGSDHFALLGELVYAPEQKTGPHGIAPAESDQKWSREICEEEKVSPTDVPEPGE